MSRCTTRRLEPAVKQVAHRAQVLLVDLVEKDLRGETVHFIDRMQMVQHGIGSLQDLGHQRFADALLEPVEVQAPLGFLRLPA